MKKLILIPAIFSALALNVVAKEQPVDELFKVMSIETQLASGFEAMLPMIEQIAADLKLDNEGKAELIDIFRTWFREDIDRDKIYQQMKQLYVQAFSDDEIREITAFYQTAIGKKFIEVLPNLMKDGAQIGMQEAQVKQAKLMARLKPFLEKHKAEK
ncbi:DUF2059 domain-containing protein [Litorilituus sediminis]|uniref:DUF2059 domain-containing protein n=1 Tax=Litorilituus sediminis TaxID=718192 RepID=A0A4P6P5N7_9GAMM|nr:DUF2059 domain-containing protein [Litorilituus sediminis]QBG34655.1 DUF2059 domain-containing protein [Litorilituus sediminis]